MFSAPAWVPDLPFEPPNNITIGEFIWSSKHGRRPAATSRSPFTCGLTGKSFTVTQAPQRINFLARGLAQVLKVEPNKGLSLDKVIAIFSPNTIDYIPLILGIHRIGGIVTPASASHSPSELEYQLKKTGATAIFTCVPLLSTAKKAAEQCGITHDKIFIMDFPGVVNTTSHISLEKLVSIGEELPDLEALNWPKGEGARRAAFICMSSGTSGLPKACVISHYNVIANVLATATYEKGARSHFKFGTQVTLGLLPMSHIYGLVTVALCATYQGDELIVLPKFTIDTFLDAIQRFKIRRLYVAPPIIIQMLWNRDNCLKHDLSSVASIHTGGAPLYAETAEQLLKMYPNWHLGQGYGMTETATLICTTSEHDIYLGSSGSLLPGIRAKVIGSDGKEIFTYETPGELFVQSPSIIPGYLGNGRADEETFVWDDDGRWIKTGDEVVIRKGPSGNEHIVIVDRIKELIKVKGFQVPPAELEAHLLTHVAVQDCAVIPVPDESAGERPKAFIVKKPSGVGSVDDEELARQISLYVQNHKASHKWLKGGIEFVNEVPKSPSGKILRRVLMDLERKRRAREGPRL
ncbi:hypothetical protein M441DRAFT_59111 [Trichoderma asperellum CBS 433.97]|uniref:AMP-dependent synthetase/ligase domain-containing protein n=1 Tax=Trichoderma asperellum (strain ATCC 204424 / CBS 433.97 / NBRC 101777) TaxID=1042311 RepID=A0A2T3Z672_TRIA4|nr:hypothetical protein M441DRAFT_59111 [Trichoderma asperellum CBS 433.97]PTB40321.1 hypothetical protein M441DRAFT_59111 [Trichoderma asperellum CBS 433.97]